ncbi:unnamed protein product [Phytomonas sp. Hart1]|nr:unnamed protein product [Phytomonas sp. Hart1]|eukprot:CCW68557.1 unnamed protein product [Phytomonas sp. isolate Hart1]
MEIPQKKDDVDCIECSECAVPVGTDGPQRATLLLPCQHVMHLSCIEFVKRCMKLINSYEEVKPSGISSEVMLCPGCQQPVSNTIPLFPLGEVLSQPSEDAENAKKDFERIHHAQKMYLKRLHRTLHEKECVMQISRQCAALHAQRTELLRDVEQHNQLFPSLKAMDAGSDMSISFRSLSFTNMTTTELELYLMQTIPVLNQTQTTLLEKRRAVEKHKRSLLAFKEKYHSRKKTIKLAKKGPSTSLDIQGPEDCPTRPPAALPNVIVESTGRESLGSANEDPARTSTHFSPNQGEAAFIVDVDAESIASERKPIIAERRRNPQRSSSSSTHPQQRPMQTVFEAVIVSSGEEEDDNEQMDVEGRGEGIPTNVFTNNHISEGVVNDKELTPTIFFPRWVSGRDMERKVQIRQLQLLPRRENYLWQSTLPF